MFEGVDFEIHVELRPMQVVGTGTPDLSQLAQCCAAEPGKVLKGGEHLSAIQAEPHAAERAVTNLDSGSTLSTLSRFHRDALELTSKPS